MLQLSECDMNQGKPPLDMLAALSQEVTIYYFISDSKEIYHLSRSNRCLCNLKSGERLDIA